MLLLVYILLIFYIGSFFIIHDYLPSNISKKYCIITYIVLSIVAGLRYNVGTDFSLYQNIYNDSLLISYSADFIEIGYLYLNKFFRVLGFDYQIFLLFLALLINYLFFKGFYILTSKNISSIFYYVTTGIYFNTFNIMRQSVVLPLSLFVIYYVKNKKYIFALIIILVGSLFHRSALVLLIILLFRKVHINPISYLSFLGLFIILLNHKILDAIILYSFRFLPLKYHLYIDQIFQKSPVNIINLILPTIILFILILYNKNIKINNLILNIYYLYYFILILSANYLYFIRVANYFEISLLILLPQIENMYKKDDRWIVRFILFIVFSIYIIGKITIGHNGVYPYKFKF